MRSATLFPLGKLTSSDTGGFRLRDLLPFLLFPFQARPDSCEERRGLSLVLLKPLADVEEAPPVVAVDGAGKGMRFLSVLLVQLVDMAAITARGYRSIFRVEGVVGAAKESVRALHGCVTTSGRRS